MMATTGSRSACAVATPQTALIRPGPEVVSTTPGLPGAAAVRLGHERPGGLVPHGDEPRPAVGQRIEDRRDRPARNAEDERHPLGLETADQELGAGLRPLWLGHRLVDSLASVRFKASSATRSANSEAARSWRRPAARAPSGAWGREPVMLSGGGDGQGDRARNLTRFGERRAEAARPGRGLPSRTSARPAPPP